MTTMEDKVNKRIEELKELEVKANKALEQLNKQINDLSSKRQAVLEEGIRLQGEYRALSSLLSNDVPSNGEKPVMVTAPSQS